MKSLAFRSASPAQTNRYRGGGGADAAINTAAEARTCNSLVFMGRFSGARCLSVDVLGHCATSARSAQTDDLSCAESAQCARNLAETHDLAHSKRSVSR